MLTMNAHIEPVIIEGRKIPFLTLQNMLEENLGFRVSTPMPSEEEFELRAEHSSLARVIRDKEGCGKVIGAISTCRSLKDITDDYCVNSALRKNYNGIECLLFKIAMEATTREELFAVVKQSLREKQIRKLTRDLDSLLAATWRLEYDLGVPAPGIPEGEPTALDTILSAEEIHALIALFEREANVPLKTLANEDGEHYGPTSRIYARAGSSLFWGLLVARGKPGCTLGDIIKWSVVPPALKHMYSNTDKGYEDLLMALSSADSTKVAELLLKNWPDYVDHTEDPAVLRDPELKVTLGEHPMHPDAMIVARWRLEYGIGLE